MKRGFTLIELLAVIVILAIIALIATPIVLSIINDSKESAVIRSAEFYVDAVKNKIMQENMKQGGTLNPSECIVNTEGNVDCDETQLEIEVNGQKPDSGSITFDKGKVTNINLTFGDKNVSMSPNGELVLGETVKKLSELAVISESLGVTSIDGCASSGTCVAGTAFAIAVNNDATYKFYVINDSGTKVTLIMSENLGEDVAWYTDADDISKGPLTALTALEERTSNWTNISKYTYTLVEESSYYKPMVREGVRARMPNYSDIVPLIEIGCEQDLGFYNEYANTTPAWLNNDSYMLSDLYKEGSYFGYYGSTGSGAYCTEMFVWANGIKDINVPGGIRPVIELYK